MDEEREKIWLGRLRDADARATRSSVDLAEALAEICKIKGNSKEWTYVADVLPRSDTKVLVVLGSKFITEAYYYQDSLGHHWSSPKRPWEDLYTQYVTHWMPMPDLPKEETK